MFDLKKIGPINIFIFKKVISFLELPFHCFQNTLLQYRQCCESGSSQIQTFLVGSGSEISITKPVQDPVWSQKIGSGSWIRTRSGLKLEGRIRIQNFHYKTWTGSESASGSKSGVKSEGQIWFEVRRSDSDSVQNGPDPQHCPCTASC